MKSLYIFGASGHAKVALDVALRMGGYNIRGLLDDNPHEYGSLLLGYPVLGGRDILDGLNPAATELFVAIGNNHVRRSLGREFIARGFTLATLIHPSAQIASDVTIGPGTALMAGVIVNPATTIGPLCVLNTGCSVDHDNSLGEAVHICPGTRLGGHVTIGDECWIGINSTVIECRTIGQRVTVGAGAVVIRDVADDLKVVGVPAKPIAS
jgi:sugar O-acyltransferase (sialic acid O-acetyltransferase NeuD family)